MWTLLKAISADGVSIIWCNMPLRDQLVTRFCPARPPSGWSPLSPSHQHVSQALDTETFIKLCAWALIALAHSYLCLCLWYLAASGHSQSQEAHIWAPHDSEAFPNQGITNWPSGDLARATVSSFSYSVYPQQSFLGPFRRLIRWLPTPRTPQITRFTSFHRS